jgi:uncharacterized membrane protein YccF (DUF307 family)
MAWDWEWIEKTGRSPWAAGAAGAMVTALRFMPGGGWVERAVNVACGSAAAGYITPALAEWWHMAQAHYISAAAFAIGLLGMAVAAAALAAVKDLPLAKIVTGWIERKG